MVLILTIRHRGSKSTAKLDIFCCKVDAFEYNFASFLYFSWYIYHITFSSIEFKETK